MRLFIAIPISEEIKLKIVPVYQELKKTGANFVFVSKDNLHLTIIFLGDVQENKVVEIVNKVEVLIKNQKSFSLDFKGAGVFPSLDEIKVVWIGVESLELKELMKRINISLNYVLNEVKENIPYLTIARNKSGQSNELIKKVIKKFAKEDFGSMKVEKVVLFSSKLTVKGPIYTAVKEFSLS
ncbi:RNA 2',3'-cyclic phosphodiesterase [Candidatus Woesearchaeota archaeon]|nr:RNA 2',3'-cyclic phosphodiesterase [Candidatus Woesearchaeota archaeon]